MGEIALNGKMQRRDFLKLIGVGAGAAGAATVGAGTAFGQDDAMEHASPIAQEGEMDWQMMNQHHQEGIQKFLDNIGQDPLFWRPPLEYTMDGDVKVFDIVCQEVDWETEPGVTFPAMTYNGIVPGPEIRVTEGDKLRFNVTNEMTQSTAIHWHGLLLPNSMDGVPYLTQEPIDPGETFVYEFTARNPGTHMYHSHNNSAEQVTRGLLGSFIIEPKDKSREPEVQGDYTIILNDSSLGFTLNGKSFPATQPIVAKLGDKIRIRYMNEGLMIHPMHLHGMPQTVFAKDGWYLPVPYMCDTVNIAPGERYDVVVDCTELGVWAYHCHILTHAEGRMGMFGMVTALVVQE
jgi:FtsP/CotA-like multicopper oxidase with cupredoxin domain